MTDLQENLTDVLDRVNQVLEQFDIDTGDMPIDPQKLTDPGEIPEDLLDLGGGAGGGMPIDPQKLTDLAEILEELPYLGGGAGGDMPIDPQQLADLGETLEGLPDPGEIPEDLLDLGGEAGGNMPIDPQQLTDLGNILEELPDPGEIPEDLLDLGGGAGGNMPIDPQKLTGLAENPEDLLNSEEIPDDLLDLAGEAGGDIPIDPQEVTDLAGESGENMPIDPQNATDLAEILEELPDLAENPKDLLGLVKNPEDLLDLAGGAGVGMPIDPQKVTDLGKNPKKLLDIAEIPEDQINPQKLTDLTDTLEGLLGVAENLKEQIDPQELTDLAENLKEQINPQELTDLAENPEEQIDDFEAPGPATPEDPAEPPNGALFDPNTNRRTTRRTKRSTGGSLEKAQIKFLNGKNKGKKITCAFNPQEYTIRKSVDYSEHKTLLNVPIKQFTSGVADELSMELFFDTTQEKKDVRSKYIDKLDSLLAVDGELHAPPKCRFVWGGGLDFKSVLLEADKRFTKFRSDGVPVRAWVDVTFREYKKPKQQKSTIKHESTDKMKVWTVSEEDTLWLIAAEEYGDTAHWRTIAQANDIENPRDIEAGMRLSIPPL